ncbi:MAG TPA: MBL fold metallo-hydrolase [Desulfobacteraceae bacterium]|nr:MBL fold metallo-hydrolase [Desulfobacteraceae bacterium]
MMIKFWGVRGSIPTPGPNSVKYGGNTLCLQLSIKGLDRLIIIDAGSGIRELGNHLVVNRTKIDPIKAEIFLTHTHWDHIQGIPFFAPIYSPETEIRIHGPCSSKEVSLQDVIGGQLAYHYFPVRHEELAARISYTHLTEGRYDLGDGITLITKYLNHSLLCLGLRFQYGSKVFCTAYDTEPFRNLFSAEPEDPSYDETMCRVGEQAAMEENRRLEEFFEGADLLVHDAQYTQQEYESSKIGWGHSSIEHAIEVAKRSQVKRLALFHHDPMRTDAQIDELSEKYCQPGYAGDTEVFFAREGVEINI